MKYLFIRKFPNLKIAMAMLAIFNVFTQIVTVNKWEFPQNTKQEKMALQKNRLILGMAVAEAQITEDNPNILPPASFVTPLSITVKVPPLNPSESSNINPSKPVNNPQQKPNISVPSFKPVKVKQPQGMRVIEFGNPLPSK